jgi:hypothetical protein
MSFDHESWFREQAPIARALLAGTSATIHPYGFIIFSPPWKAEDMEVRIHVWLRKPLPRQTPDWPAHAHDSDMRSFVIAGSLINRAWLSPRLGFGDPLFAVRRKGAKSVLLRTDIRVHLGNEISEVVDTGTSYHVPKGVFHDTRNAVEGDSVSVCFFARPVTGQSFVVGKDVATDRIAFDRGSIATDLTEGARAIASAALGSALS